MRRGFTLIEMMIVVAIIAVIASITIPSLLAARRGSLETNAVGSLRAYCGAQGMFKRNDWDGDAILRYAGPANADGTAPASAPCATYADLYYTLDNRTTPTAVNLVDSAFAVADNSGAGAARAALAEVVPRHGYTFLDMEELAGVPINWISDFGLSALTEVYSRTGYRTFIVNTNGTVFGIDQTEALQAHVTDYPADPQAAGYVVAE